jgi:two-component system, cell cycle response regulator DivK
VSLVPDRPLVLVVEDDRDSRLLFLEWLKSAGFRVAAAHNGLQALERAIDLLPDAVLTDLRLPGIDGYELTRRLKTDARTKSIPVLAVTGYPPFTQDPLRAERAGCDGVLLKPCDPDDIVGTLKALINDARGRRSA